MKRTKEKNSSKKVIRFPIKEVNAQTYQVRTPIDNKKYVIH